VTRDWDGRTYDRISDPLVRMGAAVVDRLVLEGDERVLDAGCGSGRVTEIVLERLPRGSAIALDASPSMIEEARARLSRFGERVEYLVADLAGPLAIERRVDAILSTATFHWVADHDALFRNLAAVLRPGGQLVAQCGGAGNIATLTEVLRHTGDGWTGPWTFATPEETRRRLEAAGFDRIETWLHDEPVALQGGEELDTYLETIMLRAHLDRLPPADRPQFVRAVADALPSPVLDYVRLNIIARLAD
jgi:trans-aconitate 2-methyltransferase